MSTFQTLTVVAAVVFAAVGTAQADNGAPRTRTQVIAELDAARSSGELQAMCAEDSGSTWLAQQTAAPPAPAAAAPTTPAAAGAARAGSPAVAIAMHGEDSGSMALSALPYTGQRTSAQVQAELAQARVDGELQAMVGEDSGSVRLSMLPAPRAVVHADTGTAVEPQALATAKR